MLKVGAAQTEIMPKRPFYLAGMGIPRMGVTIADDLYAGAVYTADDKGEQAMVISCDLLNVKDDFAMAIRQKIMDKTGVPQEKILICATHVHSGPKTGINIPCAWEPPEESLLQHVRDKIVEAGVMAFQNKKPAVMGYRAGRAENCAFNRRFIMKDGSVRFAWRAANPDRIIAEGPVDESVQTVWFEDEKGEILAVWINFACHPICMCLNERISADFPGQIRRTVQCGLGRDIPVLYLQGACGNVATMDYYDPKTLCEDEAGAARIGRVIGGEVLKLISEHPAHEEKPAIQWQSHVLEAKRRPVTLEEFKAAKAEFEALSPQVLKGPDSFKMGGKPFATMFLYEEYKKNPIKLLELNVLALGNVAVVTNPVEYFVEYQLELKEIFKGLPLLMAELTNGHAGYLPSRAAFAKGGYEVERSMASYLEPETGMDVLACYKEMLGKLFPQYKNKQYYTRKFV